MSYVLVEVRKINDGAYQKLVDSINKMVGRQAVTSVKLKNLIKEAKTIRKTQGTSGLLRFASALPHQFFTQKEIDKIQKSPQWDVLSNKMIDLLVSENVVSPFEAVFMRKFL